ncbi:MAG TPA: hypothetical protein VGE01_03735 [Fimbriimonas sp.]
MSHMFGSCLVGIAGLVAFGELPGWFAPPSQAAVEPTPAVRTEAQDASDRAKARTLALWSIEAAAKAGSDERPRLLGEIVPLQARAGDVAGALKTASLLPRGESVLDRDFALAQIAVEQVNAGDFVGAKSTIEVIDKGETSCRAYALNRLAYAQARSGDVKGALETAYKVGKDEAYIPLCAIAWALHRKGQPSEALAVLNGRKASLAKWISELNLGGPIMDVRTLDSLVKMSAAQAKSCDYDEATSFIEMLRSPSGVAVVVAARRAAGDPAGADRVAKSMHQMVKDPPILGLGLGAWMEVFMVQALLEYGDIQDAVTLAEAFPKSDHEPAAWFLIANHQIVKEDLQGALRSYERIERPCERSKAAALLAIGYAESDATTAERYLVSSIEGLKNEEDFRRATGLAYVAKAQWTLNHRDEAAATLREAERLSPDLTSLELYDVFSQIEAHDLIGDHATLARIAVDTEDTSLMHRVAALMVSAGDPTGASNLIMKMAADIAKAGKRSGRQVRELMALQAKIGNEKTAEEFAHQLPDHETRAYALLGIAEGLVSRTTN